MTNEAHVANGTSTHPLSPPAPVSAAALVGGVDPRARPAMPPREAWHAPLSMSWHPGAEEAERPAEEMSITWGPTSQKLTVGSQTFVHEGAPTMFSSSGVARLLLAASAPNTPWRPVGDGDDVRRAEFNAAIVEMLLDMVLVWATEGMPAEMIAPQIASSSDWLVAAPSMVPFPSSARDAVMRLMTDIDAAALARLSPIFFERRKVDRRGFNPAAIVSFPFRSDQVFSAEPDMLQVELARQLQHLKSMAMAPKTLAELSADELALRAFGQPDQVIAMAAREEMVTRLHRFEATGTQPTASMMGQLTELMGLVSNLYYLVKPSCRICALPATHMLQVGEQRDYRCDVHPIPSACLERRAGPSRGGHDPRGRVRRASVVPDGPPVGAVAGAAMKAEVEARIFDIKPLFHAGPGTAEVLLDRLRKGLAAQFPYVTFRIDIERERFVFGRGGDSAVVDRMRAFCAGFMTSLPVEQPRHTTHV